MATPAAIFPLIEGLAGVTADNGTQVVGDWIVGIKQILRGAPHRSYTDYVFHALSSIIQSGAAETNTFTMPTATAVYGLLLACKDQNADAGMWVTIHDADTSTFDGTAALNNDVRGAIWVTTPTASTTVEDYYGVVYTSPIVLATGLTVNADGVDGTNPTAAKLRGWILYRSP